MHDGVWELIPGDRTRAKAKKTKNPYQINVFLIIEYIIKDDVKLLVKIFCCKKQGVLIIFQKINNSKV